MKLSEMLEFTAQQWLDDRADLVDGDPDSIWSDTFLIRSFNEAQRIIARRAWCIIEEGVPPASVLSLKTGVPTYALHKSVLRLYTATPSDQEFPLYRSSEIVLRTPWPTADIPFDINSSVFSAPGRPIAIATDAGTRQVRIFRTPSATENGLLINLKIARLPITWLDVGNLDDAPEIPDDYHYLACMYAAGRALTLPNVDAAQKPEGRALLQEFDVFVKEARQDRQRAEMEPTRWAFSSDTAMLDRWGF